MSRALADEAASQPREEVVEQVARAMCDSVNGVGDFDENIDQRRTGWERQARVGIAAYTAALHDTAPTDQAQRGGEVERCAKIADDAAEGSRLLHNAAAKDHDRDGCNIHAEGWRTGLQIAAAIRALISTPDMPKGDG